MTIRFTLVGGPTAVLEIGGLRIITDPTFDEPQTFTGPGTEPTNGITKTTAPALGPGEIGSIDIALVSHDHHIDNLDISGREFLKGVPIVFTTPAGALRLGEGAVGLNDYGSVQVPLPSGGEMTVTGVPAHHGPEGVHQMAGPVVGFVLSGEDLPTVYISGDNSNLELVRDIANTFPNIDMAVLFVGGASFEEIAGGVLLTMSNADAVEIAGIMDSAIVVPVHADGWAHLSQNANQLRDAFREAGIESRAVVVEPGATADLNL